MTQQLATTFNKNDLHPYKKALTNARPDQNSTALWYRLPETLKWNLENKKDELIDKIKKALKKEWSERKNLIKEVFVELLLSLETWFTKEQVIQIVENLEKFNSDLIVPITFLKENDYLFEEFHWPTDAFKDIALQMVTSMVSIIVEEENKQAIEKAKNGEKWQILKFVITQTSTSWDTWPAWWSWIEGKKFVMNVIGFPENEATYAQKWQMMRLKQNVKSIPMNTSFSKIQESMLKWNTIEFREELKKVIEEELKNLIEKYHLKIQIDAWSFNSINPWRVDGQTVYHSYGILQAEAYGIIEKDEEIIEVIPSGNGWHMYSVLMAKLQTEKKWPTIVTCNRNNMFYRIIEEWKFQKPEPNSAINEPSVSMIIEYPNNMIRLFSYAFGEKRAKEITDDFFAWKEVVFSDEERKILKEKLDITAVENSWEEELKTIGRIFKETKKLVCPHTANAILGLEKYRKNSWDTEKKALISATASPWKFLASIATWLSFEEEENLEELYNKYKKLENSKEWTEKLLNIIKEKFEKYGEKFSYDILPENLREIYTNWYKLEKPVSPENFGLQTLEFLKQEVAPMFKRQVEKLIS